MRDELFFIDLMAEDIEIKKPKFVFVDVKEYKTYYLPHRFEYLPYLLKNSHFQEAWKPYHYYTTIKAFAPWPVRENNWDLYLAHSVQQINPKQIDGEAVILTGDGATKTAYYVYNHQLIEKDAVRIHQQVQLTAQENLRLPRQDGKVDGNGKNANLIRQLIKRAIHFPAYQYRIYQREDSTSTAGMS